MNRARTLSLDHPFHQSFCLLSLPASSSVLSSGSRLKAISLSLCYPEQLSLHCPTLHTASSDTSHSLTRLSLRNPASSSLSRPPLDDHSLTLDQAAFIRQFVSTSSLNSSQALRQPSSSTQSIQDLLTLSHELKLLKNPCSCGRPSSP